MKASGKSYKQIAEELGCSVGQAFNLVKLGSEEFLTLAAAETIAWKTEAIANLTKAGQELWIQWERSKNDRRQTRTKHISGGVSEDGTVAAGTIEVTEIVEPRCGDPRYMSEFRACIDEIGKLRGVFTKRVEIKTPLGDSKILKTWHEQMKGMRASTHPQKPKE